MVLREPAGKESQLFQLQVNEGLTGNIRSKFDNRFCLGIPNGNRAEQAPLKLVRLIPDSKAQQFVVHGLNLIAQ